jgi:hypothetical protein
MKKSTPIVVLPPDDGAPAKNYGNVPDIKILLTDGYVDLLEPDMAVLYEQVSSPNVHIKDKINLLLRLHMFYSKEMFTSEQIDNETVWVYRARKEALGDLKRMIEILNEYSSIDNFDVDHPLYNKSLSFIIETILTGVKTHTETSQFDSIVRDVAIALPGVEARVRNMIRDSSTEEILALRSNPLMETFEGEKQLFIDFVKYRDEFISYMEDVKSSVPKVPKKVNQ